MKLSIKSFLARVANRNSSAGESEQRDATYTNIKSHTIDDDDDDDDKTSNNINRDEEAIGQESGPSHDCSGTVAVGGATINDSSCYQSAHSTITSAPDRMVPSTTFSDTEYEQENHPQSMKIASMDGNHSEINSSPDQQMPVDINDNYLQDDETMLLRGGKKFTIKSILKRSKKTHKEKSNHRSQRGINKRLWLASGFQWKDRPTPREEQFIINVCEMIAENQKSCQDLSTDDSIEPPLPQESHGRGYDLESYDILQSPPSVLDLTLYDDDEDEFGVFFDQRFVVTDYPMEGNPCGLYESEIVTGVRMVRKPVLKNVRTATIVDSYEVAPIAWKSKEAFCGKYAGDDVEAERYRAQQKEMVERSNWRNFKDNPQLEEFKNGTWRLMIFGEPEQADKASEVLKDLSSDEIQRMFGLSEAGSIILNVDHIDVVQGKCGFNRGKATQRFMVPLGQEATKRDRMQDIRRKWNSLFSSYSLAIGNLFGHPRNKQLSGGGVGGPGDAVSSYALSLAQDPTSTFSRNIENFITCTKDSREMSPQIMMRNMRQFMSGMKNYLVKHGEADFHQEVQRACGRLKADEFLNLDTILEGVMHKLVVLPLREHLYGLFVDYYSKTNDIQLLVDNVKYALGKTALDIGIRKEVQPPSDQSMRSISLILQRLQEAELPLEKLDHLMAAVSTIFASTGCPKGQALNADDFLPLLVYVVARTGFVGAEIEAEFMWGLLQPSLLSGEAGYYLTALCSAVHVLKTFKESQNGEGTGTIDWRSSMMPACSSVLRVIIPDEYNGSLQTRTLPVRPHTTTKEVCRIIAHKARITNPQDFGLFQLVDGEETLLMETDCPQEARLVARGKHCLLAYKRIDAKIAWPTMGSAGFH